MNTKRIAFFGIKYFPSQGGSSRIAENIAKELQLKYSITVYCYNDEHAKTHLENVRAIQLPRIPLKEVGVFLYYFLCCLHILFSKKYDVIHVHKTDSAIFIPLLRLKAKVIATSQEAPYLRDKWNFLGKAYMRLMEQFFIYGSTVRTSVSNPLAKVYMQRYAKNVHYIPNGVNINTNEQVPPIAELLKQHDISGEEPFIFFAARRIMATKGCHTLLEALHLIDYKGKVVIAGQESHAKAYMRSINKLAEGLDVSFLCYIDSKETLMGLIDRSHFFIFPSLTEGLSLMLLEVACRGTTPIICSDIPENTEVFALDEVLYFEANNSTDLADKFSWAMTNTSKMIEMSLRAKKRVISEYSSAVVAQKYGALYEQLLAKR
ncbi:glycosyltransferase family 4 protein [uncultured Eudoraea sp.]|uniref:glycosyltransferase family 4 protein n=1 Tax=uncultured Eudoraea sp. TaxID=1035614 RepID=UPI0026317C83|nr:glycosyltransferase family 4 protein [uncultured Eudoraea sp.]